MSNQGKKLADKKKNDILKKFLNAQQYTKNLKKNASSLKDDNNYAAYSYDEIRDYPEMPFSAKLPSTMLLSKDVVYSMNTLNNDSQQFDKKLKIKKVHYGYNNDLTQSSNQIPSLKAKKSSYSQIQKSQGDKSLKGNKQISKLKQFDVQSQNKQKYSNTALHQSLGGMKTQSFFKLKNSKKFNYSNVHQYESERLSGQDHRSFESGPNKIKNFKQQVSPLRKNQIASPYNLSSTNFIKLINKVEELESLIILYQQAILQLKKKINSLKQQNYESKCSQIFIDALKQELLEQKNKSSELRQKICIQEIHLKEYEKIVLSEIQKIGQEYSQQIARITKLQKQNLLLKYMLRLQLQNPEILISSHSKNKGMECSESENQEKYQVKQISISKNLNQFKNKFALKQKQKTK